MHVTAKVFVTSLPVENHFNAVFSNQFHEEILRNKRRTCCRNICVIQCIMKFGPHFFIRRFFIKRIYRRIFFNHFTNKRPFVNFAIAIIINTERFIRCSRMLLLHLRNNSTAVESAAKASGNRNIAAHMQGNTF